MRMGVSQRVALILILAGAIASVAVAVDRVRFEVQNRSVEVTMDQQDLADFAHAYGYRMDELLRQMRRNGLTSVAVYEEIGQRINLNNHAYVQTGQQIIDAARMTPVTDQTLAGFLSRKAIEPNGVYILVYDLPTLNRYLGELRTQLENPANVHLIRSQLPAIIGINTQIDFFNSLGLGIPEDIAGQVRRSGLLVDPRVQNNERLGPERIDAVFQQMLQSGRTGTIIFFGQRNEVLGYPNNLEPTADTFKKYGATFGDVEAYDPSQIQHGTETLGRLIPAQTARVQAIAKLELDKLDLDTVVARYLLGVRERNIRVIYLRPFPHVVQDTLPDGTVVNETAEQTNLKMLRELRDGLAANGFSLGRAGTFVDFKGPKLDLLYAIAGLGCTAAFLLLVALYGLERRWFEYLAYGVTGAAFIAGVLTHHDAAVRKVWALGGALTFAVLAGTVIAGYFATPRAPRSTLGADARDGIRCLAIAAGVATLGGLFVVGLLSQAAFMLELNQFLGVKALLVVPPLALLLLYVLSPVFGRTYGARATLDSPLKAWQFAAVLLVGAAAVVLLVRSGNQPDVGISSLETHLRGSLTAVLGARPRFKEFLIGWPALMLLPALAPVHRRAIGWLIVLAGGVGLADVLDTFSHIHTSLAVDVLRLVNGLVLGIIIGVILQVIYRSVFRRPLATVGQDRPLQYVAGQSPSLQTETAAPSSASSRGAPAPE